MAIIFDELRQIFHIHTKSTSYIILLYKQRFPLHMYWGNRVYDHDCAWTLEAAYRRQSDLLGREPDDPLFSMEYLPFEYPAYGTSDFRPPAYTVEDANGDRIAAPVYTGHRIEQGKQPLQGLPSSYCETAVECQTLVIELRDTLLGLDIELHYTVFEGYDVIARHTEFAMTGGQPIYLKSAHSMSIDVKQAPQELIQLCGTALRETHMQRRPIAYGTSGFESTRGISSHQQNPFVVLANPTTDEHSGEAWGVSLVYSGNFRATVEGDMYGGARLQLGINPMNFSWKLEAGERFCTPEALLVYSASGLNELSQRYHRLFRERLSRGRFRDCVRPVLLNTWEAAYFDFTHDGVLTLASLAQKVGVELLVVDDGWFGKRNNSRSSLGDWYENTPKLPHGLKGLANDLNDMGLQMGLWFEPEMVSPDSDLYREHPDWCIHVEGRKRTEWRSQLVLDLSRDDVRDFILETLTRVLSSANISYVKWDNNRRITEAGSALLPRDRKGELSHRYMLNLYYILEELTKRFPNVLFENCASGGARFDPGMMHYFSQNWASDNTDAISRLKIQYGASLAYPPLWITAHVSASPNHQMERVAPLQFREHVSQPFNMGYELDLTILSADELEQVAQQIARYKQLRELVQFGTFYRLKSPYDGKDTAWQTISQDKSEVLVWYYKPYAEAEEAHISVKLRGLDLQASYRLLGSDRSFNGSVLMNMGLALDWKNGDHFSQVWHFVKAEAAI